MFANHAHVFPADLRPKGSIENLLRLLDTCGFERAVAFAPFWGQWGDHEGDPVHWLAEEVARRPDRLVGYAALNPEQPDALRWLRIAQEVGFPGIKMHPAYDKWAIKSPRAYEFYALAQELGMALDFHTGVHQHRIADYHPLLFDDVAADFPRLTMVFEHVGGYHFFKDMLAVLVNHLHGEGRCLYAGIASVLLRDKQKFWYLGPEGIETLLWQIGERKLIYGLDFPYNGVEDTRQDLEIIRSMGLDAETEARILGGNLREMLRLSRA